jgi:sulfur relay (sulfurtransferase) DsrF/TusC family protein
MANSICVIIRHPPYGREDAYAGIRNAVVTQQNGLPTTLVFCGPGVWNLTGDHRSQAIGMPSNASAMADFFVVGGRVYVDTISLKEHGLEAADLPEGVQVLGCEELAEVILGHDVVKPLCGGY